MKTTLTLLAVGLLCADARRGQQQGHSRGRDALNVLEACSSEIDFTCALDVSATDLVETLTAHKAEVDAWKANGKEGDKPERPSDEVKASLQEVRQCMKAIKPELAEDSECLAVLSTKGGKGSKGGKDKENENDGARRSLAARGDGRRGKGKGKALNVLEACSSEIDFTCTLDVSATDLVETLTAHKAEVDAWKSNGKEGDKPERPSDEVKASLEEVRQCMKAIKPELAEDSECLAVLSAKGGKGGKDRENENDSVRRGLAARGGGRRGKGKGGKGKGGRNVVQAIASCGNEIESSCALNFDIYALADAMSALKAAKDEANERGEEPASVPEEVKEQAKAVHACVRDIKDNSQCLSAALARPGGDGFEDNDAEDK